MINVFIYYKVKGISLFTIKNLKYFLQHLLSYPQYKSPVKEKRQKPLFKRLPTGGRVLDISLGAWVGRCGLAPDTLTLFKTKIADFPTQFKTEFRFLIPCLRHS